MKAKYKVGSMPFKQLQERVNIPKFQRGLVWKPDKRKSFIDTVLSGNPFGSLLLYYDSDLSKVSLIDGLQRYTTLKSFIQEPLNYVDITDYCKDDLIAFAKSAMSEAELSGNRAIVEKILVDALKNHFSLDVSVNQVIESLVAELPFLDKIGGATYRLLYGILSDFRAKIDISDMEVPYIMYEGDFDELPSIFEETNTKGTKLTKYDVFSAKWSKCLFDLDDTNLLVIIDDKYRTMVESSDTEISNYSIGDIVSNHTVNLYEYCYALGKLLKDKCTVIFQQPSAQNKSIESVGFLISAAILCNSTKTIHKLPDCFHGATSKQLENFKDKILECAQSVEKILYDYLFLPNNENPLRHYIETQIVCIIATLFKIRYIKKLDSLDFTHNPQCSKCTAIFKKQMPIYYLYDFVIGYWNGSGDTKATSELNKQLSDNRYLSYISADAWRSALRNMVEEQENKPTRTVNVVNKIILNYLLRCRSNTSITGSKPYEIDLVVTKHKLTSHLRGVNGMCALGNLCIFPRHENRAKSDEILYDYHRDKKTLSEINYDLLDMLMYPEESELAFVRDNSTFTAENYKIFLKDRHNYLINLFVEYYA